MINMYYLKLQIAFTNVTQFYISNSINVDRCGLVAVGLLKI